MPSIPPGSQARPESSTSENAAARHSRHAHDAPVIDLNNTYRQLARPWSHAELAAHYQEAERRGAAPDEDTAGDLAGALSLVAAAIPPAATTTVAIHVLHALPESASGELPRQLLATASRNTASALRLCHLALEGDGAAHSYQAKEWLPVITDITSSVLQSARLDEDPPTVVEQAQQAIGWLSRGVVELHEDSVEAATTLSEALARLLVVWVFTELARQPGDSA
jgi:hypothetical protein